MKKENHITAFYIEVLLMTLVLIGIVLVLTQIFALGRRESAAARELTDAVCRRKTRRRPFLSARSRRSCARGWMRTGNAVLTPGEHGPVVSAGYDAALGADETDTSA